MGTRIGMIFLIASSFLILVAYSVLSHNLQTMLTDDTIQLVGSMIDQGVTMIEYEIKSSQNEIASLANTIPLPTEQNQSLRSPTSTIPTN